MRFPKKICGGLLSRIAAAQRVMVREKKWGEGRSFVEQDKGSTIPYPGFAIFRRILAAFPPLRTDPGGSPYGMVKIPSRIGDPKPQFSVRGHAAKTLWKAAAASLAIALLAFVARVFRVRISLTDSAAAPGIYRVVPGVPIRDGDLIAACLPAPIAHEGLSRGYLEKGDCPDGAEPVAKLAGALPGDLLEVLPGSVSVDGMAFPDSATSLSDSHGRPLPHVPWGQRQVASGKVWLFGFNDPRSWDSRYFGPVPLSAIRGVLKPVLTW
jgi:conjugative transfer signal peptidase TraF